MKCWRGLQDPCLISLQSGDLWGESQAQCWHLSWLSPSQLGKSGQMKIRFLSHLLPRLQFKLVLTSHSDSLRLNIVS